MDRGANTEFDRLRRDFSSRERLFELASVLSVRLLGQIDFDTVLHEGLAELGALTGVDRIYLFENEIDPVDGRLLTSQRYEWVAEGVEPQIDNPELQRLDLEAFSGYITLLLGSGEAVKGHVSSFPLNERELLDAQGIVSILMVPIFLDGQFWGFIGFDSVRSPRLWSQGEERILRLLAASLGASIHKRRADVDLRQAAAVFESTRDTVMFLGLDGRILSANPALLELTGYGIDELVGQPSRVLDTEHADEVFYQEAWRSLRETGHWHGENWHVRKDGTEVPMWLSVSAVYDTDANPTHFVAVGTDISHLKHNEARLKFLSEHDVLTELPNRRLALHRLAGLIEAAGKQEGGVAVLFIDLDRFKDVNDSLGHGPGDEVLKLAAERMRGRLRGDDTLARLGGDEFLALVDDLSGPDEAMVVAANLLERIREPIRIDGREVHLTASVGIALFPEHGDSPSELVRFADLAMYEAKSSGRDQSHVYHAGLSSAVVETIEIEAQLRRAMEQGSLALHYQPKVDVRTGTVVGFEALLRVPDGNGGFLRPDRVIRIAERSGLINQVGHWVIDEACRQCREWRDAGLHSLSVAVNVSARQFYSRTVVDDVAAAIQAHGIDPRQLEVELTETVLMDRPDESSDQLGRLRELGVRIALDDFGTGYSSLAYLTRFPIDVIKIDGSFVRRLPGECAAATIVRSIVALGTELGMLTIAECVETGSQREFLEAAGCDQMQGYLFSRPVPADAVPELLEGCLGTR